jgi:protein O-GlcNAc transferase
MSKRDDAQNLQIAFSFHRSGKFAEAAALYRKIIKRNPREAHALHSLGIIEAANGNGTEAAQLMARSLSVQPANVQFVQNYATVLCQLGRYDAALVACQKALEIEAGDVYLLYVAAGALTKLDRSAEALTMFDRLLALAPNHVAGLTERGSVLSGMGRHDAALADIDKALSHDPRYAEAHLVKGVLYGQLKRHDDALASLDLALRLNPQLANAWLGRGNVSFNLRRNDEAFAAYDKTLALQPGLAEAWLGRGNVLFDLRRHGDALSAYDRALAIQPALAEAWLGRGNVLFDLRRCDEALAAYDKALARNPNSAEAWAGRGNVFTELKRYGEAVTAYDRALALKPDLAAVAGERIHCRMQLCDWAGLAAECDDLIRSIRAGKESASPFAFLAVSDSREEQLVCARSWVDRRYPGPNQSAWRGTRYSHDKIRVAYLSADFRQHPVAYLTVGMFEAHDRSRFETFGVSIGPNDGSDMRGRLERCFDHFMDREARGVDDIAQWLREREIDILVDLNGFTQNARPLILARRPAPVQVNYLGFAGTMGADYLDYIVADPTLIPASHRDGYAEKIVYLPESYMPHDDESRAISDRALDRAEFGLPEHGVVFCCFNNAFKFNPEVFRSRMRILSAVKGSVLWLSAVHPAATENLRREASAAGVDPSRLVFAGRVPLMADHLARHRLADLFLDTLPYNAHTTASDALWAGLPVLTQIGETLAGRVAASLLTAIGLPELITQTQAQFESQAIELATKQEMLVALKGKLARHRSTTPLFNTKQHVRHLESAYIAMFERNRQGLPPEHIHVGD